MCHVGSNDADTQLILDMDDIVQDIIDDCSQSQPVPPSRVCSDEEREIRREAGKH
jgi:hypothetical protein